MKCRLFFSGITLLMCYQLQAEEVEVSSKEELSYSAFQQRWDNIFTVSENPFALLPYQQNYFLYSYSTNENKDIYRSSFKDDDVDEIDKHEAKFQISLLIPVWRPFIFERTGLFASYTQVAMWQATNNTISSPFRETNYEPQFFVAKAFDWNVKNLTLRAAEFGFNHQSNGRAGDLSRSWNRLYSTIYADHENFSAELKVWYRLQEDKEDDDNPDINRYLGYYHVGLNYRWDDTVLTSKFRYNWNTGYGSSELGVSYPVLKNLRIYGQVFSGYGETMIDYNHNQTRVGIGVMLEDLL